MVVDDRKIKIHRPVRYSGQKLVCQAPPKKKTKKREKKWKSAEGPPGDVIGFYPGSRKTNYARRALAKVGTHVGGRKKARPAEF